MFVLGVGPACDTVAEITFVKESLKGVTGLGYRPNHCTPEAVPATSLCKPPGCGKIDFVMETTVGRFMSPNIQVVDLDGRLTPGTNFGNNAEDVVFERTWLFQLDAEGNDQTCADAAECATGFECRSLSDAELPANSVNVNQQLCVQQAVIEEAANSTTFTALGDDPQPENDKTSGLGLRGLSLIINMDNSGSLMGKDMGVGAIDSTKATDRDKQRLSAVKSFLSELLLKDRSTVRENIQYGVFVLSGTGANGVENVYKTDTAIGDTFVANNDPEAAEEQVQGTIDQVGNDATGNTPVWESIVLAANAFTDPMDNARGNYARRILTFADSDSDGSGASTSEDQAIAAMKDPTVNGIATIVHLDSEEPAMPIRTGPIAAYNQLACETGGYYRYENFPSALEDHYRDLGLSYEGTWSVDVEILTTPENQQLSELDPGWYRVSATMTVRVAGEPKTFRFMKEAINSLLVADQTLDRRLLVHVPAAATP